MAMMPARPVRWVRRDISLVPLAKIFGCQECNQGEKWQHFSYISHLNFEQEKMAIFRLRSHEEGERL